MDAKLSAYLEKKRQEQREIELEKRSKHLLELGLIDDSKTKRIVCEETVFNAKYDRDEDKFYIEVAVPIEITDDEYAELCTYNSPAKEIVKDDDVMAEVTLSTIATVTLCFGILGCAILLIVGLMIEMVGWLLLTGVILLLSCLIIWSLLKVFSDMSLSLKEIKTKLYRL